MLPEHYVLIVQTSRTDSQERYFLDRRECMDMARFIGEALETSGGRAVVKVVNSDTGLTEHLHTINAGYS